MSDYECYCEPSEGEPWTILVDKMRTARKTHKCCECQDSINPGEKYHVYAGVLEGDFTTYKQCEFCYWEFERLSSDAEYPLAIGELACALVAELRGTE